MVYYMKKNAEGTICGVGKAPSEEVVPVGHVVCTQEEYEAWFEEKRVAEEEAKVVAQAIPTIQDDVDAMLIDYEYRLTLLELGVTG